MHPADDVSSTAADSSDLREPQPLDRAVAREAAAWLVRLREDASPADVDACARWRAADPEHERAWQRARRLNEKFATLPASVSVRTLGRRARTDRRFALKALAVAFAVGPAGYAAYRAMPWRDWMSDQRTAVGERRFVMLADGTRIDLNTSTAIDIAFTARERRVVLNDGEILVETGRDAGDTSGVYRPFIVETRQGSIRALGTRFVVRNDDASEATRVAVLHGAVEVTPADAPERATVLDAGQQTRFTATAMDAIEAADRHAGDWSRGVLFADGMRLADFVGELGRYRRGLMRCDPEITDLRITGAFQLDNIENVLAALPRTLPVTVVYRTRYWVTITAASHGNSGGNSDGNSDGNSEGNSDGNSGENGESRGRGGSHATGG
ncbi:FecR domain-containing protein [Paraburkholderia sp. 2C]